MSCYISLGLHPRQNRPCTTGNCELWSKRSSKSFLLTSEPLWNSWFPGSRSTRLSRALHPERYQNIVNRVHRGRKRLHKELAKYGYGSRGAKKGRKQASRQPKAILRRLAAAFDVNILPCRMDFVRGRNPMMFRNLPVSLCVFASWWYLLPQPLTAKTRRRESSVNYMASQRLDDGLPGGGSRGQKSPDNTQESRQSQRSGDQGESDSEVVGDLAESAEVGRPGSNPVDRQGQKTPHGAAYQGQQHRLNQEREEDAQRVRSRWRAWFRSPAYGSKPPRTLCSWLQSTLRSP